MVISEYLRPLSLKEAFDLYTESKRNYIIGGGAWLKLSLKSADKLISLDKLGLDKIDEKDGYIEIGSMVTLRSIETNQLILSHCDGILAKAIHRIMGINIRNIATIGGSVIGKFGFSDIITPLLVMDTKLIFYKMGEISLEDFLAKPKHQKDILLGIKIKKEKSFGYFKKAAITPLDFSIINIAVTKNIKGFRICVGSTPYIGKLAVNAMKYINGLNEINEDNIIRCAEIVLEELKFSKNNRSSKEYREELAKVYVKRGIRKVIADEN